MGNDNLKDEYESLKIRLKHLQNNYVLLKEENENSIEKYLEILSELEGKNKELQQEIAERKQMEQMLIQSEKMASIGTLAAGIAHEINNPMGYIYSNLRAMEKYNKKSIDFCNIIQVIIEEYSNSEIDELKELINKLINFKNDNKFDFMLTDMKDAIEESIEGSEKVKKIVSDLKDFSRVEKYEMKLADVNDNIEKTLNIVWNELKYKAKIVKEFRELPEIKCDIQRLSQVFMNVLVNAAHAIEKNGIITIKTFCVNNSIVIQISDNGKGIPEANINRIFDAFFTTKEPGKGTGLGLSISYKIIQNHKGIIDVESEVGKGTTFTIKLPIDKSKQIKEYKILIIDDDENIIKIFTEMINDYEPSILVKTAKDGFEVGDLLNSFMPDLVLLDIKMPGMDGFEVCRRIKTNDKTKGTKIIMITGFLEEYSKEKSYEAGAIEFLIKPIEVKTLYSVLDKIIKV